MIEAMQWCNPSDNLTAFREREGRRIVAWIRSLQGEARYERGASEFNVLEASQGRQSMTDRSPRIAVHTINGWRYMQPGQWAVVGVSWFLVSNTESPDSMAWHVRDFKIMTNADYLTYKKVNGVMADKTIVWCPYPNCQYSGAEDKVNEHRTYAHRTEKQAGSNLKERPR